MILTGPKIEDEYKNGRIRIDPLDPKLVGPNSVDLRLHNELRVYTTVRLGHPSTPPEHTGSVLDMQRDNETHRITMPKTGYLLHPGILYLGRTIEAIGSDHYVPIVEGRSSVGRLGIRVHQTAGFCDTGFHGTITLEIDVLHPVIVYPGVPICQAYFLRPDGPVRLYKGRYQDQLEATPSRFWKG